MKAFWMVYGAGKNMPTRIHYSFEDAQEEATRLAQMEAGKDFYVLEAKYCYKVESKPVTRTQLDRVASQVGAEYPDS